jgi:hypothetical protein
MAKVIYKYDFGAIPSALSDVTIQMKAWAKIVHVDNQHDHLVAWALVEEDMDNVYRHFYLCWTGPGNSPPEGAKYVGTGQFQGGNYVLHLFEKVRIDLEI